VKTLKLLEINERTKPGVCLLVYSAFGWGKTFSVTTLPGKTAYIKTEPRDHKLVIGQWMEANPGMIDAYIPKDFDDLMDTFNTWFQQAEKNEFPYENIFFDSASFFMQELKLTYEDARLMDRVTNKRTSGDLITDRYHLVDADVGGIASVMTRLVAAMNRMAIYNVNIIWTATVVENPKYNMALSAAPSFLYRAFPQVVGGFFDFIGFITEPWRIKDDGSIKPPVISFISSDDSFTAKCCSTALARKNPAPLDFGKIFKVIKGQ
jgi:hypothetical protein